MFGIIYNFKQYQSIKSNLRTTEYVERFREALNLNWVLSGKYSVVLRTSSALSLNKIILPKNQRLSERLSPKGLTWMNIVFLPM